VLVRLQQGGHLNVLFTEQMEAETFIEELAGLVEADALSDATPSRLLPGPERA